MNWISILIFAIKEWMKGRSEPLEDSGSNLDPSNPIPSPKNIIVADRKNEIMKYSDITLVFSFGHGATDPITGDYHCIAGGKEHTFEDGYNIREGDLNRSYERPFVEYAEKEGFRVEVVSHDYLDYSLSKRVMLAEAIKGKKILIAFHHNASPNHNARGYEIFTTRGENNSDDLAEAIWFKTHLLKRLFPEHVMRSDIRDGDHDKEANFVEIRSFNGPAVYIENGFFDYMPDLKKVQDDFYRSQLVRATIEGIKMYLYNR